MMIRRTGEVNGDTACVGARKTDTHVDTAVLATHKGRQAESAQLLRDVQRASLGKQAGLKGSIQARDRRIAGQAFP